MPITTVGLDADDTLWHNETIFRLTQDRLKALLADVAPPERLEAKLAEIEKKNLRLYGYGVKGFTLSMIETAMELTGNEPPGRVIADILAAGREMLSEPVEPLPGVDQALADLSQHYRLVLITKATCCTRSRSWRRRDWATSSPPSRSSARRTPRPTSGSSPATAPARRRR